MRYFKHIFALVFALALIIAVPAECYAVNATAYTYTRSSDYHWVKTQDAYLVDEILFGDFDLSSPEDIYIRGNRLYI